jgi:Protein of unknown function (DUF2911)
MKITGWLIASLLLPIAWCSCNNEKEKKETNVTKTGKEEDSIIRAKQQMTVNPYDPLDISPMDMTYYPADYPKLKMTNAITAPPVARVIYSRPHLQGRQLFHDLLKYDEPWRLGANESTELQLYQDVTIQNKKIKAGRYVLYCIPHSNKWTIILNSNIDSWGLQPDSTKDIANFNVPVKQTNLHLEYYTMIFEKIDNGAELVMAWDDLEARLPINF